MSDDYKSLEHTIRNIHSKVEETTSENKSLEHTIRNIREGFISVGKKTSKFSEITNGKVYGDRTQPITQHAVQPKQPAGNEAIEKAKEAITSHDWAGDIKSSLEKIAKDKEQFAKNGKKISIHREESSFADRTTKPIDEKKKKVSEEEPKLHSEMNVNVSGKGQFQGGEFASAPARSHPGHITPHGHSDKAEIAGAYRKAKKEKLGLNRVAEGNIEEAAGRYPSEMAALQKKTQKTMDFADKPKPIEFSVGPVGEPAKNLPSVVDTGTKKAAETTSKALTTAGKEVSKDVGALSKGAGVISKLSRFAGPVGAAMTAADIIGGLATGTETGRAIGKKIGEYIYGKPELKPTEPKIDVKTEPKIPAPAVTKPAETPKPVAVAEPKTATDTKPAVPVAVPPKTPAAAMVAPKPFIAPSMSKTSDPIDYRDYLYRPPKSVGHAKSHQKHGPVKEETDGGVERKKIQNVPRPDAGDRHKIAFVGRKDDDPKTAKEKTSRQAAYKTNVIDESKKLAGIIKGVVKDTKERREDGLNGKTVVYPQVIINPNLKHNTMDAESDKMPNDHK